VSAWLRALRRAGLWAAGACVAAFGVAAYAQTYCPSGSSYNSNNYGSGCKTGTCWSSAPFQGSQSGQSINQPYYQHYSCSGNPPPPPPSGRTYQYLYDNQGNLTSVDGPLTGTGDTTTNLYDALNRMTRTTQPGGGQVNYGYNALDQLVSVTDPRTLATNYTLNGLGNLNQQVSPDTGTTTNTYDAAGNVLTSTDAKSQVTTYTYDALNRVASATYQGGVLHTYQYDQGVNGKGRLTTLTEPNSTTQYVYDSKGRLTSETRTINAIAYATGYGHDSFGRLSGMTYPSGRTVAYTFDSLGRIQGITTTQGTAQTVVSSVAYYPFGGVQGFTFGNSQIYTRGYDTDGRIAAYTLGTQSFALGYDNASRISFINDIGDPPNSNTYGYDNLDRLTSAVIPSTPFAFTYDGVGNRLTKTVGSSTDTYAPATTSNRLASITPASGPVRTYTHDANGAVTADGTNTYTYDTRGRLTQSVSVIGTTNYQVNAAGQRIRKTNTQGDTVYHYDNGGKLIAESSPIGTVQREYIYLGDMPVAVLDAAGGIFFIHNDHLDTPRVIANGTSQVVWRWDHAEPFGTYPANQNPSGLGTFEFNLRLPGQYFDKETNLHYNYFRDYDPGIGRYVQSDPIGLRGGINTYGYGFQNPLSNIDPYGLEVRLYCRPVVGPIGWLYDHCFVYVTCPAEGWSLVLSLFGNPWWIDSMGSAWLAAPGNPANRDDPSSPKNTWDDEIKCKGNKDCAYERSVIDRFIGAPAILPYMGTQFNSNNFARYLVTDPRFGATVPLSAPTGAPGLRP
jgi:RHS repeat-associated protein